MSNLSPAAQAFWGSIIRHLLTGFAGILVAHGYVSKDGASSYTEELVGIILQAAVMGWANRVTYWNQIRALIGRSLPAGSTAVTVDAKVNELVAAKALPSVFLPADQTASLVKP